MNFYDEVLRELIVAFGGALFAANAWALVRRQRDREHRAVTVGARNAKAKGASRVAATGQTRDGELVQAPFARSAAFAVLGFVMMIAGIAALATS
ncbi:MAG: hypothetical protein ABIP21_09475 [Acidimicrobiia bacterium]